MTAVLPAATAPVEKPRPALPNFRSPRRPDIEGLRAVAVLSVIAFHASVPHLAGGFVGVDVFFVISGFLITGLLLTEGVDRGRISLKQFYARRARRILPAAAITLIVTALASYAILPPLRMRNVGSDLALSALYSSNWRFIALDTNYLTQNQAPSPVLHFWSLAVEEQFYLVWPLLIIGGFLLARRLGNRLVPTLAALVVAASAASFALSVHWTHTSAPLAYLSSPSRVWQFGTGALLAILTPALTKAARFVAVRGTGIVVGWAGLVAVLVACIAYNSSTLYPGTAAVLPTAGAVAMILGGVLCGTRTGTVGELLQTRPMRAVGRLSFSWYLWHWPALVLVQAKFGTLPWEAQLAVALASAGPAYLTLRLVERPIRFNRTISARWTSGIAVGVIATVVALTAALLTGTQATKVLLADSVQTIHSVPLAKVFGPNAAHENSGPVTPSPLAATTDFPTGDCITDIGSSQVLDCHWGPTSGPQAVLFGDSHAHQWEPAFMQIAPERGWGLTLFAHSGCPAAPLPNDPSDSGQPSCDAWRAKVLARIAAMHPALIIVSSYSQYLEASQSRLPAWNQLFAELRPDTKKLAYLADTPDFGIDVPSCISGHLSNWSACDVKRSLAVRPDPVINATSIGKEPGLSILDMNGYLCPQALCPAVRGGVLFYRDTTHITATLAAIMTPAMSQALTADHLMAKVKTGS